MGEAKKVFVWTKPKVLIVTFGVCLTWYLFAYTGVFITKLFHVQGINMKVSIASMFMLAVGFAIYLVIIPAVLGFRSNFKAYFKGIGVTEFNQRSWLILFAFIALTLVISALSGDIRLLFSPHKYPFISYAEPPLLEELMFRGIIMSLLLRVFSQWFSIFWTSFLFSLIHVLIGLTGMIDAFIGALLVFSILRVQTKNIWSGVFAHFVMVRGLPGHVWLGWEILEAFLLLNWLAKKSANRNGNSRA